MMPSVTGSERSGSDSVSLRRVTHLSELPTVRFRKSCTARGRSVSFEARSEWPVIKYYVQSRHVLILVNGRGMKLSADIFSPGYDRSVQQILPQHYLWAAEEKKGVSEVVPKKRSEDAPPYLSRASAGTSYNTTKTTSVEDISEFGGGSRFRRPGEAVPALRLRGNSQEAMEQWSAPGSTGTHDPLSDSDSDHFSSMNPEELREAVWKRHLRFEMAKRQASRAPNGSPGGSQGMEKKAVVRQALLSVEGTTDMRQHPESLSGRGQVDNLLDMGDLVGKVWESRRNLDHSLQMGGAELGLSCSTGNGHGHGSARRSNGSAEHLTMHTVEERVGRSLGPRNQISWDTATGEEDGAFPLQRRINRKAVGRKLRFVEGPLLYTSPVRRMQLPVLRYLGRTCPPGRMHEHSIRIVLAGDAGVGKSEFAKVFGHISAKDLEQESTSGGASLSLHPGANGYGVERLFVELPDGVLAKVKVLDTKGTDVNRTVLRSFIRGAQAFILFFDCCKLESFEGLQAWYDNLLEQGMEVNGYRMVCNTVIGTKVDLSAKKHVVVPELLRIFEGFNGIGENGLEGSSIGLSPRYADPSTVRNVVSRTVLEVYRHLKESNRFTPLDTETVKPTFWGTEEVDRLNRKLNNPGTCC